MRIPDTRKKMKREKSVPEDRTEEKVKSQRNRR